MQSASLAPTNRAGLSLQERIRNFCITAAHRPKVKQQIIDLIGAKEEEIILASAKAVISIEDILEAVVKQSKSFH